MMLFNPQKILFYTYIQHNIVNGSVDLKSFLGPAILKTHWLEDEAATQHSNLFTIVVSCMEAFSYIFHQ